MKSNYSSLLFSRSFIAKPLRSARNVFVSLGLLSRKYEQEFTTIYHRRYWGADGSVSGGGSSLQSTQIARELLPHLFAQKAISSILDIPCGDFHWMQSLDFHGIDYTGGDIVAPLIEENKNRHNRVGVRFMHLDVINDPLPRADLVLCRDCLVHLPLADTVKALRNISRSGATWLLTTTFPERTENKEIAAGKWRPLNLQIEPISLPPAEEIFNEQCTDADGAYADKSLGLWRCETIRKVLG